MKTAAISLLTLLSLHPALAAALPQPSSAAQSVGSVTWHAPSYIGKTVALRGYVLSIANGDVLFSDEATGAVSAHDLPVEGPGAELLKLKGHYLLTGVFVRENRRHSNGSRYHLQLTTTPSPFLG